MVPYLLKAKEWPQFVVLTLWLVIKMRVILRLIKNDLAPLLHLQIEPFRDQSQSSLLTSAATLGCMLQPTGEFVFRSTLKRDPLGGGFDYSLWCLGVMSTGTSVPLLVRESSNPHFHEKFFHAHSKDVFVCVRGFCSQRQLMSEDSRKLTLSTISFPQVATLQ